MGLISSSNGLRNTNHRLYGLSDAFNYPTSQEGMPEQRMYGQVNAQAYASLPAASENTADLTNNQAWQNYYFGMPFNMPQDSIAHGDVPSKPEGIADGGFDNYFTPVNFLSQPSSSADTGNSFCHAATAFSGPVDTKSAPRASAAVARSYHMNNASTGPQPGPATNGVRSDETMKLLRVKGVSQNAFDGFKAANNRQINPQSYQLSFVGTTAEGLANYSHVVEDKTHCERWGLRDASGQPTDQTRSRGKAKAGKHSQANELHYARWRYSLKTSIKLEDDELRSRAVEGSYLDVSSSFALDSGGVFSIRDLRTQWAVMYPHRLNRGNGEAVFERKLDIYQTNVTTFGDIWLCKDTEQPILVENQPIQIELSMTPVTAEEALKSISDANSPDGA
ncbi:uncharacterized protein I303_108503 [Kwoniella dejecticola CBS 10117]|uniref:Uncharacterized protein n=1 Tax=Kwoniella dejecticola CBS 10117 TaxID=1296121 RepID=A0A1A5ZX79_9TREE|nr:uncharacterized protein I303_07173 [Kwoniella dejecticola CBS 10117]OBR82414.1 hypothetical protein I303_07173 [Kwoniella dejecticola CBS 10117]